LRRQLDVVGDSEVELRLYRERVLAELERRSAVVEDVNRRVAEAQFAVDRAMQASKVATASTARKQVESAHRAKLKESLKALERQRAEAVEDLERAESRLKEVDIKLDELNKEPEGV